ncbi:histidinol-phosphatase [bacterium]|nr:histidinol-phosphatase [bacterium]
MTPSLIINEAKNRGLNIIGITDHNTTLQAKVMKESFSDSSDFIILTGVEICSSEEVHSIALFDSLESLSEFQNILDKYMPETENVPEIFGDQVVIDFQEQIIYEESRSLLTALNISIQDIERLVHSLNGIFILAHVDRNSFSIYSQLGFIPFDITIDAVELSASCNVKSFINEHPELNNYSIIRSSDAHYPNQIGIVSTTFDLDKLEFKEIKKAIKERKIL